MQPVLYVQANCCIVCVHTVYIYASTTIETQDNTTYMHVTEKVTSTAVERAGREMNIGVPITTSQHQHQHCSLRAARWQFTRRELGQSASHGFSHRQSPYYPFPSPCHCSWRHHHHPPYPCPYCSSSSCPSTHRSPRLRHR